MVLAGSVTVSTTVCGGPAGRVEYSVVVIAGWVYSLIMVVGARVTVEVVVHALVMVLVYALISKGSIDSNQLRTYLIFSFGWCRLVFGDRSAYTC